MEEFCRPNTLSRRESSGIVIKSHTRISPGFNLGSTIHHVTDPGGAPGLLLVPASLCEKWGHRLAHWVAENLNKTVQYEKHLFGNVPSKSAFSLLTSGLSQGLNPTLNTQNLGSLKSCAQPEFWTPLLNCSAWGVAVKWTFLNANFLFCGQRWGNTIGTCHLVAMYINVQWKFKISYPKTQHYSLILESQMNLLANF